MIGVKRPAFKLGNPKPPKSAKKKKALKDTKPLADPDDATVIANPYAEYMVQKPSELMQEIVVPPHSSITDKPSESKIEFGPPFDGLYESDPFDQASCSVEPVVTEVLEEGEIPTAEEMVKNLNYVKGHSLEFPPKLPHITGFRYQLLLEKANPKELVPNQPPSLTWLEEKYGHLIEKGFWYDRTVKLAAMYQEVCEGDVFDKTQYELEKAVGHLVSYTEEEQEYLRLMENYKNSPVQIDGIPTLEFLRKHHSKPLSTKDKARMLRAERVPPFPDRAHANITQAALDDVLNEPRYVPDHCCPIHDDVEMSLLNPDEMCGPFLFKCKKKGCSVFYTSDSSEDVRFQLGQAIHPSVHQGLFDGTLKCHCEYTPKMKLSRSAKNPGRVFLSCFKKTDPCCYFQWVHWKVRPVQGPMDAFVQKPTRPLPYSRPIRVCPPELQQQLRAKSSQQLVCTGLDRFKKDNVKMYSTEEPWKTSNDPWWNQKQSKLDELTGSIDQQGGFKPSPGPFNRVDDQFNDGVYVGNNSFASDFFDTPSSSTFGGARLF